MPHLSSLLRLILTTIAALAFGMASILPGLAQETTLDAGETPQQSLSQLIEVLRDDAAREALIRELETSTGTAPAQDGALDEETPGEELRSIGGQVASFTREAVEDVAASVGQLARQLANTPRVFSALSISQLNALWEILANVALLVVLTYGGFIVLRRLFTAPMERLRVLYSSGGWVAKPVALVLELLLDILAAVIPYALGYLVAVSFLGEPGELLLAHSLYLNAFIMLEIAMALVRTVLSPNFTEQRLVYLSDHEARVTMGWSRVLASLFVFGQMLILPLLTASVSFAAGRAISILLLLVTLIAAAIAIIVARAAVSAKLKAMIESKETRKGLAFPIRYWHVFALAYVLVLAVVALTQSSTAFQAYLWGNAQIALAILGGVIALNIIRRMIGQGVKLPHGMREKSPELERQLNGVLPAVFRVIRLLIILGVVIFCLHRLGFFNFVDFIESEFGTRVANSTITILAILGVAVIAWVALNAWVDGQINPERAPATSARRRTLIALMRNALTIAIIVITLMFVLSEIGINIAPLIASAGVIGLAIGFGAQKLVQDIITGVFIQLEGAIDVGDVVSVGGISGVVERLTIRSVSLRDLEGSYHIIPFSSVDTVTNFMRGFSYALLDMRVAYREDANYVKQAMFDAFEILRAEPEFKNIVIGDMEWFGINDFEPSEVIFRGRIKTLPGQQWGVRRAYLGVAKKIFDERGIEIPYPHQTLYFGEDKSGKAPPVRTLQQEAHETTQGQGTSPSPVHQTNEGIEIPEPSKARRVKKRKAEGVKAVAAKDQLPDMDAGPDGDDR